VNEHVAVKRIFLIGDSHSNAMRKAQDSWPQAGLPNLQVRKILSGRMVRSPFVQRDGEAVHFLDPDARIRFRRLTGRAGMTVDASVLWGLVMGFNLRIYTNKAWEISAPADLGLAGRTPISAAMLHEMFRARVRHFLTAMDLLKTVEVPFFVVGAPPLRSDSVYLQDREAAAVRIAVQDRFVRFLRSELDARGIVSVMPPDQVRDESGTLRPEFFLERDDDKVHANGRYGDLMLQEIARELERAGLVTRAVDPTG
jgi:hypothetical protein